MMSRVLVMAVAGSLLTGCFQEDQFCTAATSDDLRLIAQGGGGSQCDTIYIRDTQLESLDGAEGIDRTTAVYVGNNERLTDVSAITGLHVEVLDIALNPALTDIRLGPVGGGTIAIGNNAARTIYLTVIEDADVRVSELALERLEVRGDADPLNVDIMERLPAETVLSVDGLSRLRLIGASGASNVDDVARLGVPRDFIGLYGTALGADPAKVDSYLDWLIAEGFTGELEVCADSCVALASCSDAAASEPREGCTTYDAATGDP